MPQRKRNSRTRIQGAGVRICERHDIAEYARLESVSTVGIFLKQSLDAIRNAKPSDRTQPDIELIKGMQGLFLQLTETIYRQGLEVGHLAAQSGMSLVTLSTIIDSK